MACTVTQNTSQFYIIVGKVPSLKNDSSDDDDNDRTEENTDILDILYNKYILK